MRLAPDNVPSQEPRSEHGRGPTTNAETPEQNRHSRALEASIAREADFDRRILAQHAPADGPNPTCHADGCAGPWPCGTAETAMQLVGIRS